MLEVILGLFAAGIPADPLPTVSGAAVSSANSGACSGTVGVLDHPAEILVNWSVSNPNDTLYDTKLYENGVLVATLANSITNWGKTITGSVEGGLSGVWASNWTYRVDVVRKSDSVAVSTSTSAAWAQAYGGCDEAGS